MKRTLLLVVVVVAVTTALVLVGLHGKGRSTGTIGVAAGSALPGFSENANTPEQGLANFLSDIQRRHWSQAFSSTERTNSSLTEEEFTREWVGANGGLRAFSGLERYEARPLHATNSDAQMRVRLQWSTPVGPVDDVRDFNLVRRGDRWKVVWDQTPPPNVPAQLIPVNYLRWDLVSGNAGGSDWGARNVDGPHVRIVSMNAVDSAEGAVVMGEVVNEDTIPGFCECERHVGRCCGKRDRRRKQLRQDRPHSSAEASVALSHRFSQGQSRTSKKCPHGCKGITRSRVIRSSHWSHEPKDRCRCSGTRGSPRRIVQRKRPDREHSSCYCKFL